MSWIKKLLTVLMAVSMIFLSASSCESPKNGSSGEDAEGTSDTIPSNDPPRETY